MFLCPEVFTAPEQQLVRAAAQAARGDQHFCDYYTSDRWEQYWRQYWDHAC
jgi:hypothetical protein